MPEGAVGADVEVIVVLPDTISPFGRNGLNLLQDIRNRHPHRSTEEIDRDRAAEKSAWDS